MRRIAGIITTTSLIVWQNFSVATPNQSENPNKKNHQVTIYCIGNHDSTGNCWQDSENSSKPSDIDCLIASWPVVNCEKTEKDYNINYSCIALSNTYTQNQVSLSCTTSIANAQGDIDEENISDIYKNPNPPFSSGTDYVPQEANSTFFDEAFK